MYVHTYISIGMVSPVTRYSAGRLYHQQLARQMADLMLTKVLIYLIPYVCMFVCVSKYRYCMLPFLYRIELFVRTTIEVWRDIGDRVGSPPSEG